MIQRQSEHQTNEPKATQKLFPGFKLPTSSTTYTPNQFFDVVLPNASRGCLRLVAFLIRKTLGWSDENGNPTNEHTHVSYRELIEEAGVSRGAIKDAIEEALSKRYIDCLRFGQPHKAGEEGFSALYSLRWDMSEEYISSPDEFNGFFSGNGNLTHIPNDFFDYAIPNEPLAIVKVVGVIIRHTIGFQTRYGFRRQQVEMSFSEIMRRTGIASSSTVSTALRAAIDGNYIRKVSEGFFDPSAGSASKATTFAVCWDENPGNEPKNGNGSKIEAEDQFKNQSGDLETVQKSKREIGSKIEAANGPISEAETVQKSKREAFKNRSGIETTDLNNLPKQQQTDAVVVGGKSLSLLMGRLMGVGIDSTKAAELVEHFPAERIERQLNALDSRKVKSSKTGFLIRAIERDIPVPSETQPEQTAAQVMASHFYAELGGNQGEPIALVSAGDEEAATSLLSRFSPEVVREPNQLGRDFARYVSRQSEGSKFPIRTLTLAVRNHGNDFLASHRARIEKALSKSEAERKAAHEQQFQDAYREHIRSTARGIEQQAGELWQSCDTWIQNKLARRKRMSEKMYERCIEQLADADGRADFILDFLTETRPELVPSFWAWDATINEQPFSTEGKSA